MKTYLLLVTFLIHSFSSLTPTMLKQFQTSPYQGMAVPVTTAYDTGAVPSLASIEPSALRAKAATGKDIWPEVFLNRMIGGNTKAPTQAAYFHKLKGMDLDDQQGAQGDFLAQWRLALELAREMKSPGVVLDPEAYNNYDVYDIDALAGEAGKPTPEAAIQSLKSVGAKMADIASAELPNGKIWVLFTGLYKPNYKIVHGKQYYISVSYIELGMLDRIRQANFSLTVIDGGEAFSGYCYPTVNALQSELQSRQNNVSGYLKQYAPHFVLSAPIVLWRDASDKAGWLKKGDCGRSTPQNIEQFSPYLKVLFNKVQYAWIYAANGNGGYDPFNPATAPRFNTVIRGAAR